MRRDLYFFNKYIVRQLLMNKLNTIANAYSIPYITKLLFSFSLNRIEDIDDVQAYNYIYLFRFFFGKRAFFTRLRSYYSLGKWTYSYNVNLVIKHKYIYDILVFILNDVIPVTDKGYLFSGIFSSRLKIFYLLFKDLSVFSEKKTNLGLFALKSNLSFRLYCVGVDINSTKLCLRNLKFYNF